MSEKIIIASVIVILFFLTYYLNKLATKRLQQNKQGSDESSETVNTRKGNYKWIIIIIIGIIATLPFHYIFYRGHFSIYPKNGLTFSKTYLDDDDIEALINRYNNASFFEKQAINAEPLMRKLREIGVIVEKSKFDTDNSK